MSKITVTILLIFSAQFLFSQQQKQGTAPGIKLSFDVIVGVGARNETGFVKAVQKYIAGSNTGLTYLGHCNSQHCIILSASAGNFNSADAVVALLRQQFGQRILGYKDYTVQEFYKKCGFTNEGEYQYFKKTYQ
jgi:hypothetical protein